MNKKKLDCVFLVVSSSKKSYQTLAKTYSAIEPPTWALLLAQSTRSIGYNVKIIDANAEGLSETEIFDRIKAYDPKIICMVVYGQNVNAGTANMSGATHITNFLKNKLSSFICSITSIHRTKSYLLSSGISYLRSQDVSLNIISNLSLIISLKIEAPPRFSIEMPSFKTPLEIKNSRLVVNLLA